MKITSILHFTRNVKRFKEILSILAKYGLANWIREKDPEFIQSLFKSFQGEKLSEQSQDARIRLAISELGPTFIKLGQIFSTRADLVGPALAKELSKLQSDTPADPPEVVREILEAELEKPVAELFAEFEEQAMASGSIGQTHRAKLHDGQTVVVKVQHKDIEDKVTTDLDILEALAEFAEKYNETLRLYQPRAVVSEFRRNLLRELDFRREGRNLEHFARNFQRDPSVHIPDMFPEHTSRRILTMEMLEGFSIGHVKRLEEEGIDSEDLAKRGANVFLEMIFRDNFYHADPHPGNIWVLAGGAIGLLDCGMVGRLEEQMQYELEGILLAVAQNDAEGITEHVIRIGSVPPDFDRNALRTEISEFLHEYMGQTLKDFDLSGALNNMTDIIRRYRIILPSALSLLIKVFLVLEGTARQLHRDFSLAELLKPYYVKIAQRRVSPKMLFQKVKRSYRDWDRLLDVLPRDMADILQRAKKGQFNVRLEHRRLDTVINRLVYGILIAALFLGSCQLLSRQIPPLIAGVSVLGVGGCVLALLLGIRLLRFIRKSGSLGPKG